MTATSGTNATVDAPGVDEPFDPLHRPPALPATGPSDLVLAMRESTSIRLVMSRPGEEPTGQMTARRGLRLHERLSPRSRRDALDTVWRSFPAHVPAVTAAIDSLSPAHDLQPVDCGAPAAWRHFPAEPGRIVHVTVHARGPDAVVGLHFQCAADPPLRERNLQAVIFVGVGASIAGYPLFGELVGVMLLNAGLWLTFVVLVVLAPRWRRRREFRAWSRAWQRRFWADLTGRLVVGCIYR